MSTLYFLSMISTTLLFFIRARAIYWKNRLAQLLLLSLWLMNVGTSALDLFMVQATRVAVPQAPYIILSGGPVTKEYCVLVHLKPELGAISAFGTLIYDTIVFVMISHRLRISNHLDDAKDLREKAITFFSGRRMLTFSRMILRDGQIYYLCV
jgi:hypothetical protein